MDLSEVLDFKSILESYNENGELPNGFTVLRCDAGRPVFSLEKCPGINFFMPIYYRFYHHQLKEIL